MRETYLLFLLLVMFNTTISPQSFIVVDKDGNRIIHNVSKLDNICFQSAIPGFSVYDGSLIKESENQTSEENSQRYIPYVLFSAFVDYNFYNTAVSHPLKGKKISIIGDSKSTISGNNQPFFQVQSVDVGKEIASYVTWHDVYSDSNGTKQTKKTIGGDTLTAEMIGTLQTFTPTSKDVGKSIGVAKNYNLSTTKVWSEVLCEETGAILLSNASYSGSRICSGQKGQWMISEAWNDYTIGCLKKRDENGDFITPDIIIICRGTNDFSHKPISRIDNVSLTDGIPETDFINGIYNFKIGYYKTIQKCREAYPGVLVVCCTLNVFKRSISDSYPPRNTYYTLPEMNQTIREIAAEMGCGLIDFERDGITFENCYPTYISDSATTPTHPNSKGHRVMAQRAYIDLFKFLR